MTASNETIALSADLTEHEQTCILRHEELHAKADDE